MKFLNVLKVTVLLVLLNNVSIFAQISNDNWDLILVREDKVYPSLTNDYEITLSDLKSFLDDNKVEGFNYFTHLQNNFIYSHVTPIKELKDLNNGISEFFAKNINNPDLDIILNNLSNTISSYNYYVVKFKPELSYIPKEDNWMVKNQYRKWHYFYFYPGTSTSVEEVLAAYKKLYTDKGIKMGFRVFAGFLGVKQPLYILTTWAESPLDFQTDLEKASSLLGEEGANLWQLLMGYVQENDTIEGWFLPQYSFAPGMKLAD